jgi:hypothetical protein
VSLRRRDGTCPHALIIVRPRQTVPKHQSVCRRRPGL